MFHIDLLVFSPVASHVYACFFVCLCVRFVYNFGVSFLLKTGGGMLLDDLCPLSRSRTWFVPGPFVDVDFRRTLFPFLNLSTPRPSASPFFVRCASLVSRNTSFKNWPHIQLQKYPICL